MKAIERRVRKSSQVEGGLETMTKAKEPSARPRV